MATTQRLVFLAHTNSGNLDGVKVDFYEGERDTFLALQAHGWRVVAITAGENNTGASGVFVLVEKDEAVHK